MRGPKLGLPEKAKRMPSFEIFSEKFRILLNARPIFLIYSLTAPYNIRFYHIAFANAHSKGLSDPGPALTRSDLPEGWACEMTSP